MSTATEPKSQRMEMGYLVDFEKAIENHDPPAILRLWEEYTSTDEVDGEDFLAILEAVKASELHDYVGRHVERGLILWDLMDPGPTKDKVLQLIVDLEVSENRELRALVINHLVEKFGKEEDFGEKMRIIGLRGKKKGFKGAISHYLLLNHMEKGNFVFHTAGWGVGEIMDVSMIREQLSCEFDYAPGLKDVSFQVAFQTLVPLPKTHFLSMRFGSPDELEAKAKKNPLKVLRTLLKDLGPLTAAEIKEELCELVIPESQWNKWWQAARAKLKKDPQIENPSDIKEPFRLLKKEVSHEERLKKALEEDPDADAFIGILYAFLRDFSDTLKNSEFKESLLGKVKERLARKELTTAQELQLHFFLQDLTGKRNYPPIEELIRKSESIENLIAGIGIQSFKKRALMAVRKFRKDWEAVFLKFLFKAQQNPIRDIILGELLGTPSEQELAKKLRELAIAPQQYPELTLWYFQKIMSSDKLPLANDEGRSQFFEAFLILLSYLEQQDNRRDLIKKMHGNLTAGRFALVRKIMKISSTAAVKEFLLLVTKCNSLASHDIQIFHSLAEVAHPSLKNEIASSEKEEDVIWTTKEGYEKLQKKIERIGTVETVENAKEIEVARAHGDLRENAEFKAALEKRDRLQAELKLLSDQLNKCRILTKQDVSTNEVSVGTRITMKAEDGSTVVYTLLGPWDADVDQNILSFQSKLAKAMIGLKKGDRVTVKDQVLTIDKIESAIDPKHKP